MHFRGAHHLLPQYNILSLYHNVEINNLISDNYCLFHCDYAIIVQINKIKKDAIKNSNTGSEYKFSGNCFGGLYMYCILLFGILLTKY